MLEVRVLPPEFAGINNGVYDYKINCISVRSQEGWRHLWAVEIAGSIPAGQTGAGLFCIRLRSKAPTLLEEWPSGLRRRTANPQWALSSTASSNLASSVSRWRAKRSRRINISCLIPWHCGRAVRHRVATSIYGSSNLSSVSFWWL